MKKFAVILLIFLPVLVAVISVPALTSASPFYFLSSASEIFELKFAASTQKRAFLEWKFANRRIGEVSSLAADRNEFLIQPALEKYWSHLGEFVGILDLQDEDLLDEITQGLSSHYKTMEQVYSLVSDPSAKRSLRTAVFRLSEWEGSLIKRLEPLRKYENAGKLYGLRLQACQFLAQEASSSALNEVEKDLFQKRAQKCFKTD